MKKALIRAAIALTIAELFSCKKTVPEKKHHNHQHECVSINKIRGTALNVILQ